MKQHSTCLVIGGGISGLMAATTLQQQGITVTVVDKGYGIGGRLASRSVKVVDGPQGYFDYGSQFFSGHTPQFETWLQQWLKLGLIQPWADGFENVNGQFQDCDGPTPLQKEYGPYYRGTLSTRSVAQSLATNLNVRNQTRIETLRWQNLSWEAIATDGQQFVSDILILTAPVPQSLELLEKSDLSLVPTHQQQLKQVVYDRCIALLVVLAQESLVPDPGGLYVNSAQVKWIASNSIKGISPNGYGVTIHATPEFSLAHWDDDKETIVHHLCTAADPWLGAPILAHHVHRWKYSQPTSLYPDAFAIIELDNLNIDKTFILAGDGFASVPDGTSVERAALSGQAAAAYLLTI